MMGRGHETVLLEQTLSPEPISTDSSSSSVREEINIISRS